MKWSFHLARIAGIDRYETNWKVVNARYSAAQRLRPYLASAERFPDPLVVGPLAARERRPLLLVGKTALWRDVRPWVYANRAAPPAPTVVGGPASVSAYVSPLLAKMRMGSF